jgi:hypothetical protein
MSGEKQSFILDIFKSKGFLNIIFDADARPQSKNLSPIPFPDPGSNKASILNFR